MIRPSVANKKRWYLPGDEMEVDILPVHLGAYTPYRALWCSALLQCKLILFIAIFSANLAVAVCTIWCSRVNFHCSALFFCKYWTLHLCHLLHPFTAGHHKCDIDAFPFPFSSCILHEKIISLHFCETSFKICMKIFDFAKVCAEFKWKETLIRHIQSEPKVSSKWLSKFSKTFF